MKFIVDAQFPYGVKSFLLTQGYDTIHTEDLPLKDRTPDWEINKISLEQQRIVVTKDIDFLDSYYLKKMPFKLLLITTGNIVNRDLYNLFTKNISAIIKAFSNYSLVEMDNNSLIIHE
ncbi:MAG: DUF5615 family PIN-like protein [Ginsengibacter sp.]